MNFSTFLTWATSKTKSTNPNNLAFVVESKVNSMGARQHINNCITILETMQAEIPFLADFFWSFTE
ncbi:hypothetical protein [Dapis sp. BLCC M172]|uniref:hypothetical protein n=1 Tax=Dapis sp. BLCC M172 TaxID=2975281 RepID=UPI003CF8A2AD